MKGIGGAWEEPEVTLSVALPPVHHSERPAAIGTHLYIANPEIMLQTFVKVHACCLALV